MPWGMDRSRNVPLLQMPVHKKSIVVSCPSFLMYHTQSSQLCLSAHDHRQAEYLLQPDMLCLLCSVRFRIFEPLPAYREACPYILVTSQGTHPHPIPLPHKTPPIIRAEVSKLLGSLNGDLPDLTSRRFLRHPVVAAFLSSRFPEIAVPMLSDLHISLANRSHLRYYINAAKKEHFPAGTGWDGNSVCVQANNNN